MEDKTMLFSLPVRPIVAQLVLCTLLLQLLIFACGKRKPPSTRKERVIAHVAYAPTPVSPATPQAISKPATSSPNVQPETPKEVLIIQNTPKNTIPIAKEATKGSDDKELDPTESDIEVGEVAKRDPQADQKKARFAFLHNFFKRKGDKQRKAERLAREKREKNGPIVAPVPTVLVKETPKKADPITSFVEPTQVDTVQTMLTAPVTHLDANAGGTGNKSPKHEETKLAV